ncbi:hypothetical protein D6851_01290 [Altericroceibacterium spongiae]|uniref:Uncharacterized protein n=1 Tax=Altericroceibacterium spongiae TaxID=2320269 RepID=A0A420ER47_9SPHN|nr:tetratricopeptide repeat protein [Altericroceibacterium spongiae]RKF23155.1 hypothetical protein D6851_01290 [Altericroceibacterium spongiae]
MIGTMLASLLTTAIAPTAVIAEKQKAPEQIDVAYEQLLVGETDQAIATLEQSPYANDPARLINLGTAHAQAGDYRKAAKFFRAALASDTRYQMELADGSWMDSRAVARTALTNLESRTAIAMR